MSQTPLYYFDHIRGEYRLIQPWPYFVPQFIQGNSSAPSAGHPPRAN